MAETRKYGIIELLQRVGEANVGIQNVDASIVNAQVRKGGVTALTILTDAVSVHEVALGEAKKVGLIVWFPADLLASARAALSRESADAR